MKLGQAAEPSAWSTQVSCAAPSALCSLCQAAWQGKGMDRALLAKHCRRHESCQFGSALPARVASQQPANCSTAHSSVHTRAPVLLPGTCHGPAVGSLSAGTAESITSREAWLGQPQTALHSLKLCARGLRFAPGAEQTLAPLLSHNPRVVGVGRVLWRAPGPAAQLTQVCPDQLAQEHVPQAAQSPHEEETFRLMHPSPADIQSFSWSGIR